MFCPEVDLRSFRPRDTSLTRILRYVTTVTEEVLLECLYAYASWTLQHVKTSLER
jgi:hypothetical protein